MSRDTGGKRALWTRRWVQVTAVAALLFGSGVAVGAGGMSGSDSGCHPASEQVQR